ncbi:MAG: hypothetical protein PHZ09_12325 [Eubacteriales bacterium]|nr:hypothetical protein [Eubacteriales bacterium]
MDKLMCGFAQRKITPELNGTFMDGYGFRLSPATGIRDDLYVKVCVFINGKQKFAITSFDLCGMSPRIYNDVSAHISAITGLDISQFALCNTHTHAGPACDVLADLPVDYDYYGYVGELTGKAINEAFEKAAYGHFDFRFCNGELTYSYNRRRQPPIDRRIRAGVFIDTEGVLRGVISNASCHAVINTSMNISADYLSVLTGEGSKAFHDVPVLFLQGRGADINPYNPDGLDTEAFILTLGHNLADNIIQAVHDSLKSDKPAADETVMRSVYKNVRIPMKSYPEVSDLEATTAKLMKEYHGTEPSPNKHYILREINWNRMILDRKKNGISPDITVPLQTMELGGIAAFAMIPFELLTLTGNAIEEMYVKRGYKRENIYVVGFANSVNGYLAPKAEYEIGGYEISGAAHWYGISECSDKSEDAVLNAFDVMIND